MPRCNKLRVIQMLNPCDPDYVDPDYVMYKNLIKIDEACKKGDLLKIQDLIEKCIYGSRSMCYQIREEFDKACKNSDLQKIKELCKKKYKGFNINKNIRIHDIEITKFLIEYAYSYNYDLDWNSLFLDACTFKNINIVEHVFEFMLKHDINIKHKLDFNEGLYNARININIDYVNLLMSYKNNNNNMFFDREGFDEAFNESNLQKIKETIGKGVNIDCLINRFYDGNIDIVKFITEYAHTYKYNFDWDTLFLTACEDGYINIVEYIFEFILKRGIKLELNLKEGLESACKSCNCYEYMKIIELLLNRGIKTNKKNLTKYLKYKQIFKYTKMYESLILLILTKI